MSVPELLDGDAFLWSIVRKRALTPLPATPQLDALAERVLGQWWLLSHLDELDAHILFDLPGIGSADYNLHRDYPESALGGRKAVRALYALGLHDLLTDAVSLSAVARLRETEAWRVVRERCLMPLIQATGSYFPIAPQALVPQASPFKVTSHVGPSDPYRTL